MALAQSSTPHAGSAAAASGGGGGGGDADCGSGLSTEGRASWEHLGVAGMQRSALARSVPSRRKRSAPAPGKLKRSSPCARPRQGLNRQRHRQRTSIFVATTMARRSTERQSRPSSGTVGGRRSTGEAPSSCLAAAQGLLPRNRRPFNSGRPVYSVATAS
eukprot:364343-Chlamydomonas_euryale.AAC.1